MTLKVIQGHPRSSDTALIDRPTSLIINGHNVYILHRFRGFAPASLVTSPLGAFSVSAPSTWNSLPTHIRSLGKLSSFKRQLKSHLFQSAFAA